MIPFRTVHVDVTFSTEMLQTMLHMVESDTSYGWDTCTDTHPHTTAAY